jgi:hypothetical protein
MFQKPTVLVLGAGANYEVGLPLGTELMRAVEATLTFGDHRSLATESADQFFYLLRDKFGKESNDYLQAAKRLVQVMNLFPSMDEALHYVRGDERCVAVGKAAIVSSIIGAEAKSKLKFDGKLGRPDLTRVDDTWVAEFLSMAVSGLTQEEMPTVFKKVTIINFNYDRSLEHYLFWALQDKALIPQKQVKNIIDRMHSIRPYGTVGIHWGGDGGGLSFGRPDSLDVSIFEASGEIRTFTEQHAAGVREKIDRALNDAELILILGFGFHGQNFHLFDAPHDRPWEPLRYIFATAHNIAGENYQLLRDRLAAKLRSHALVQLLPKTARQMLVDLRPSIMDAASRTEA